MIFFFLLLLIINLNWQPTLGYDYTTNCDSNFTYLQGLGCYLLNSEELLTWQEARDYCEEKISFLVSPILYRKHGQSNYTTQRKTDFFPIL